MPSVRHFPTISPWPLPPGPVAAGMTIGLLGGSFNPAHEGHLYISEVALKRLGLSAVWWLVSPGNPLKTAASQAPYAARLARARALAAHPRIRVSDLECRLGTVYTVDTLLALKRRFAGVRFVWLMGSDNLEQFAQWRAWEEIVALVPLAVVIRPDSTLAPLKAKAMQRFARFRRRALAPAPAIVILDGRRNPESATRIRALGAWDRTMLSFSPSPT